MIEIRRYSTLIGLLGILCVCLFWVALLSPARIDALLRPYGLYVWFGVLLAAIVLPTFAALVGSKRWLFATGLAVITFVKFFIGVTS
jgi:hypothetical protein